MSLTEEVNDPGFLNQDWGTKVPILVSLCERIMYRHYSGYAATHKDDLVQEGLCKAYMLISNGRFDGRSSLYNYLYTGIRNEMGNFLYHSTKLLNLPEGDEVDRIPDSRVNILQELGCDDPESLTGRCCLVKLLEEDDLFNAWDEVPQEERDLFLEIITRKTNFKEAGSLRDSGVPRIAIIFLFLFAGRNIKLPSDDLLEKYQRHARVYHLHLKGHTEDEIGKMVGLRKVHITRIISSVKQTLGECNGSRQVQENKQFITDTRN